MSGPKGFRRRVSVPMNNMAQQPQQVQKSPEELAEEARINALVAGTCTVEDTNGRVVATGKVRAGTVNFANVQCTMVENDKQLLLIPPARIGRFRYDKPAPVEEQA